MVESLDLKLLWLLILGLTIIIISFACYCWKRKIDQRLDELGLRESELDVETSPIRVDETETTCGWCRLDACISNFLKT